MVVIENAAVNGLLGEVVSWDACAVAVPHARVVQALEENGLDAKLARQFAPRNAFCRACKALAQKQIVRVVKETPEQIAFQFTQESLDDGTGHLRYDFQHIVRLDKLSGKVECDDASLAAHAQAELDRAMESRTPHDVTDIVQRIFRKQADLFPLRKAGGCYFVPQQHQAFIEAAERFLAAVGGELSRLPVAAGTQHGDRSIRAAVGDGLERVIEQHQFAIASFDPDTRESTFERAVERIKETKFKLEAYAEYLGMRKGQLEQELAEANVLLRQKIAAAETTEAAVVA